IRTDTARNLHLPPRDQRTRHGCAEQILSVVDRTGAERREYEVADELSPKVFDEAIFGTRCESFLANTSELRGPLPDVGSDANDPRVVVLAQPRDDDRRVETA